MRRGRGADHGSDCGRSRDAGIGLRLQLQLWLRLRLRFRFRILGLGFMARVTFGGKGGPARRTVSKSRKLPLQRIDLQRIDLQLSFGWALMVVLGLG